MDKVVTSAAEALADLCDGAAIAITGFGTNYAFPTSLVEAAVARGTRDLCLIGNTLAPGPLGAQALVANGQVSRLIVSFTGRAGQPSFVEELVREGKVAAELVPQGTLVERLRAGAAGLAAFYTPTGVGTPVADGKDLRWFDGRPFIMECALRPNFAFVRAQRGDRHGNLEFFGSNIHFNASMAKAARVAIAEVDEIVEVGEIPPERVGLPGIFVSRLVKNTVRDTSGTNVHRKRPADVPRVYNGKPGWTRHELARRAAALLPEGSYVNLGLGIPALVSNYIQGRDIALHGENGILGYGEVQLGPEADPDVFNATSQPVAALPGTSYFDSVTAFEMARSGQIDVVLLGAYQVDQQANLASYTTDEPTLGGIGGSMDLVAGKKTLMILMEHRDSKDRPKLLRRCTYPLTGVQCVDVVVTDLTVLRRSNGRFEVQDVADGFSADEVLALTEFERA